MTGADVSQRSYGLLVFGILEDQANDGIDIPQDHVGLMVEMEHVVKLVMDRYFGWWNILWHVPKALYNRLCERTSYLCRALLLQVARRLFWDFDLELFPWDKSLHMGALLYLYGLGLLLLLSYSDVVLKVSKRYIFLHIRILVGLLLIILTILRIRQQELKHWVNLENVLEVHILIKQYSNKFVFFIF